MPRDGSGNFTLPANTQAVSGDPISSTKFNTLVQDLEADANTDRPIVAGGTGASTALAARANLGLEIGVNVQAYDAGLLSIAGLTTLADRSIYTTASDTYAVYTLTAAGRAILDDADAAAQRTTLGLGSLATLSTINNDNWSGTDLAVANGGTGASDASTALTNLGALAASAYTASDVLSKLLTVDGAGSGLDADLIDGVQPSAFALTILDDADAAAVRTTIGAGIGDMLKSDNLSGLTNYATARTNLGLAIGTDVQALDATLTALAGLATGADKLPYSTGTDTFAQADFTAFGRSLVDDADASAARTTLGLANGATTTISAFALTMLDDADAAAVRTTIGVGLGTGDLVAANNLSDVANASTARTNLGLAIGTNVQAYDQQLQDISALAVTDGGFIVGNGSTFVLETDATARASLGLGTAATVNTGTSGATVPLLNAANTFGDTVTATRFQVGTFLMDDDIGLGAGIPGFSFDSNDWLAYYQSTNRFEVGIGSVNAFSVTGSGATILGNTIWHAGNDGAGSGLDADTLDGVQGSAYATLAGSQTFTGLQTFGDGIGARSIRIDGAASGSDVGAFVNIRNGGSTITALGNFSSIIGGAYDARALLYNTGEFIMRVGGSSTCMTVDTAGNVVLPVSLQARPAASTETTGTLTVASANETIQATGDITIPNAVFAAGDIILIYAGASSRTITEGASVTMRLGGTATTGSRTLAARGVAVLFFVSSSEVVVSGGAVT